MPCGDMVLTKLNEAVEARDLIVEWKTKRRLTECKIKTKKPRKANTLKQF